MPDFIYSFEHHDGFLIIGDLFDDILQFALAMNETANKIFTSTYKLFMLELV